MTLGLFNLVIGLLGTSLFAGTFLLINKWQKKEPYVVKVFSRVGLLGVVAGLIFSIIGAAIPITLNISGLFVVLLATAVFSVFAIIGSKQAFGNDRYVNGYEFALFFSGFIFSLGGGFAILVATGFLAGVLHGVLWPLIIGWIVALIVRYNRYFS